MNKQRMLEAFDGVPELAVSRLHNPGCDRRCALGQLAHHIGVSDAELDEADDNNGHGVAYGRLVDAVACAYDMTLTDILELTERSDNANGDVDEVLSLIQSPNWY